MPYYYDLVGSYDGPLVVIGGCNLLSGLLLLMIPEPWRNATPGENGILSRSSLDSDSDLDSD